jgi:hypothetical protein
VWLKRGDWVDDGNMWGWVWLVGGRFEGHVFKGLGDG